MKLPDIAKKNNKKHLWKKMGERFALGAAYGLGQALGLTLVFAFIARYFTTLLNSLGGVPYLGNVIARIVAATQTSLTTINY
ncbi:DUF5665 domain-containing protein [Patescibacteria group bacterium]|nr:DUF5665 domain-containing protein [Patescibacteria group bacterium]